MTVKHPKPSRLLWVDLEMTGLDPQSDMILEVAALITDFDFNELARYEALVSNDKAEVLERLNKNPWWNEFPSNRDHFISQLDGGKSLKTVEQELLALIDEQFGSELAILAGNSIHQDRKFIANWWPALDKRLHYRMLDVSSLKIYMIGKHNVEFKKHDVHRAIDDIEESIDEWKYYLSWLKDHR